MSQRLFDTAKWVWCFFVLNSGSILNPVTSVTVRTPPKGPSTIEAQAKFFQDFFSVQLSPYKIEFGHVCEDPSTWEQRYEKKDFKNHRDMGKVRWGDKNGGYGEHYWDLNHAGHAGNHDSYDDSDDGSYHEDPNETYNGSDENDQSQNYETVEYNPEITSHYEEGERKKRAHGKIKTTTPRSDEIQEEQQKKPQNKGDFKPKIKMEDSDDEISEIPVNRRKVKPKRRLKERNLSGLDDIQLDREKNNVVLVINQRDKEEEQPVKQQTEPKTFVPYDGGAEVRQHIRPEIATAAPVPRLFLEPSTGHVVDRTTGQAYFLQPVPHY
ncbi:unnamed protein product, partial [Brenthis ino]